MFISSDIFQNSLIIRKLKEQHLFETEILTVTFDQFTVFMSFDLLICIT